MPLRLRSSSTKLDWSIPRIAYVQANWSQPLSLLHFRGLSRAPSETSSDPNFHDSRGEIRHPAGASRPGRGALEIYLTERLKKREDAASFPLGK